jgi:hypothetical protein
MTQRRGNAVRDAEMVLATSGTETARSGGALSSQQHNALTLTGKFEQREDQVNAESNLQTRGRS